MRATDVMTTRVITVSPETTIQALAELMSAQAISGVPVVDQDGELVGIVSEGDLLHRTETGTARRGARRTEPRRARWFDRIGSEQDQARDYLKAHARTVRDVMTRDVITIADTAGLDEVADLLETKRIKRVPVMRDGKLAGIISRANLVRALAVANFQPASAGDLDDFTIRDTLLAELREMPWAKTWDADIMVRNKIVHLWCCDDQPLEERQALRVAAENTPGVTRVDVHTVHMPIYPVL